MYEELNKISFLLSVTCYTAIPPHSHARYSRLQGSQRASRSMPRRSSRGSTRAYGRFAWPRRATCASAAAMT